MDTSKVRPRWFYGPDNQSRIIQEGEAVPDGWETHPDKVQAKETKPKGGKKGDPPKRTAEEERYRAESIAYLKEAGKDVDSITDDTTIEEIEKMLDDASKEGAKS